MISFSVILHVLVLLVFYLYITLYVFPNSQDPGASRGEHGELLSVFELRAIRQAEQDHMHREWKDMALEDVSKGGKKLFYGLI